MLMTIVMCNCRNREVIKLSVLGFSDNGENI
jgi:hypothetical protein